MNHRFWLGVALGSALALAQTAAPGEVEITAEPYHHLFLENRWVRVFKVEVPPRAATIVHWHRHDYVFVTLGDSDVMNQPAGEKPVELELKDGETHFSRAPFAHVARNLADTPFRNVTIELLNVRTQRDCPTPPGCGAAFRNGSGALTIWNRYGDVTVNEIVMDPGQELEKHSHQTAHLVIAVTDADLESDVAGRGNSQIHQRAGDVAWVPGGFTHSLRNVGKSPARYVALEFRCRKNQTPCPE